MGNCSMCNGDGERLVDHTGFGACDGRGYKTSDCYYCNNGKRRCMVCDGKGYRMKECWSCFGDGCQACNNKGRKKIDCDCDEGSVKCDNWGCENGKVKQDCSCDNGKVTKKCTYCGGDGIFP